MDHQFRGIRQGLIVIEGVSERRSRDEFRVIVDAFAAEAIGIYVPTTYRQELQGWARSYYSLEQHVTAILSYQRDKLPAPTDEAWSQTKQYVLNQFRRMDHVQTKSYKNFDAVKWIQSSAAGYGYRGRKCDFDNYIRAKRTAVTIAERLDHDRNYGPEALLQSTPDVAFTRTQLSQIKVKTKVRNVWGEAFHYVLLEGLFADPLIEFFKEAETFYFIGQDPLLAVPALIEEILQASDYVYQLDWSGFDASVQEWEIRFAFQCLETLLVFPSNAEAQIWRFLIELFIYRKIAGPNGIMYLKTQGIPSGSCFTNIIGSITNYVRIQYMFKRLTRDFATVFTHGDDSLVGVTSTQYIPMDSFIAVCAPLGWTINVDKSAVSRIAEEVNFLSRTVREGQNFREELVCLRMLMYPEYDVPTGDISAVRAMSICRDSGIHSQFLFDIFMYLKEKYGMVPELPPHLRTWDAAEFEMRRSSFLQLM